ncbi:MAG: hypothetical protein E6Q94_10345 [Burkholderiaceae bacterium]|nr:MAG: hypothetical protein E6Q94_10345 [Burkholderiaceae bacterium]
MSWFERLTGFPERGYAQTQAQLQVVGNRLQSRVNGRSWQIGHLETPSLGQLRIRSSAVRQETQGVLKVRNIAADAYQLHTWPEANGALVQVASQFNLLEMPGYEVTPEDGVSDYEHDHTQGPACARATGAATIYRNYFAPVGDQIGQTRDRQIDTLADLRAALPRGDEIEMRNGYALATPEILQAIHDKLAVICEAERDALRTLLRLGLHHEVDVTAMGALQGQRVSQAYCSALPVNYNHGTDPAMWTSFASLVLEAAYEATLHAAVVNSSEKNGSTRVYLTLVGGGVFGNQREWILSAIRRALDIVRDRDLEVWLVSYNHVPDDLLMLAESYESN